MIEHRNIRDRLGKKRPNRVELDIINGVLAFMEELEKDIKGIMPSRLADLTATAGGDEVSLNPEFDFREHHYIIHVDNAVQAVTLTADVAGDVTATGDGEKTGLEVGVNAFEIVASSNSKPDGYYKIIIHRAEA